VPALIRYFMLVHWHGPDSTVDMLSRMNIIDMSEQNQDMRDADNAAFGIRVFTFDPKTGAKQERWMHVPRIVRPVILIKAKPPLPLWKVVQHEGKLLDSATGSEDGCL
jgi:hypothetical protein